MENELLTTKEVLARLKLSRQTLANMVKAGKIPQTKFGHRTVRYKAADIDRYLADHATPTDLKTA